jgi:2-polyprenyl-6-methoxyphenol hydroxylase-like FAD-dependent oxidoreductase
MPSPSAGGRHHNILISGAGIAGPTLAFWLRRYGFDVVLVERAPSFREGGHMIDFWGVGYDVAEVMGLLPTLRAQGYITDTVRFVDGSGRTRAEIGGDMIRRALGERFFSLLRADLARDIVESLDPDVETVFGDSVSEVDDAGSIVNVRFQSGKRGTFDFVIGADGLHSAVRAAAFGLESQYEKYLGYYCAAFVVDGYPRRDERVFLSYEAPGRQASRYALRNGRTAFLMIFAEPQALDVDPHDLQAQKAILRAKFGRDGWECPAILELMDATDDLYFDAVSQIHMPAWSRGRVALVGDAAYCPSLLAGQGSAFAMAGAYIIAGELANAGGDHTVAFPAYEARLRSFIDRKQKGAESFATSFAPRTRFGLFFRDQVLHLMTIPAFGVWMARRLISDRFQLPDYREATTARRATNEQA